MNTDTALSKRLAADRYPAQGPAVSPPLVLLHGIGGGRAVWRHGAGGLAAAAGLAACGHEVLAVDLPGYGDSLAVAGLEACNPECMARQVAQLIEHEFGRPAVLIGHSMGGMVAQELWVHRPDVVAGMVLACTSAAFGRPEGDWQARFVQERLAPLDSGLGMPGLARQLAPGLVAEGADPMALQAAEQVMSAVPEATYRTVLKGIVSFDRRATLSNISVPVLCLAGDADRTSTPKVMQGMAERIPAAEFVTLGHAGHVAPLEQPAAFIQAVDDFVRRRLCAAHESATATT